MTVHAELIGYEKAWFLGCTSVLRNHDWLSRHRNTQSLANMTLGNSCIAIVRERGVLRGLQQMKVYAFVCKAEQHSDEYSQLNRRKFGPVHTMLSWLQVGCRALQTTY